MRGRFPKISPKVKPQAAPASDKASDTPLKSQWKTSLAEVLEAHNGAKVKGSVASAATQDKRADVLYAGFKLLREQGYKGSPHETENIVRQARGLSG
jgi:hypothetical protein